MQPRVVLVAQHSTGMDDFPARTHVQLSDVLRAIGVWVFGRDKQAVWQLREQLSVTHAVIIVFEGTSQSRNYPEARKAFELEVAEVAHYHKLKPELPVLTVVKRASEVLPEVSNFPTVVFDETLEPPHVRDIVEFIFNAARPVLDKTTPPDGPDINVLLAQARVEISRLAIVADESKISWTWIVIAAAVAVAGLALSIPGLLSRLALSDYWLFLGPVIFIVGALTTVYLVRRRTRGHRQSKIANVMREELASALLRIEELQKREVDLQPQTEKSI